MVEHVHQDAGCIRLDTARSITSGENIVPAGAEASQGAVILPVGLCLGANHIGAAAACGYAHVSVHPRPTVAILATGDELVELDQPLLPFQIRNSNSYSLAAQVQQAGAEPLRLPVAPDDPAQIEESIRGALQSADILILSGGVSAGRFDFVETALLGLGAEFLFTGVLMQPGRPVVFGRLPAKGGHAARYFFGLPGNPVSTLVTFALFVQPVIDAIAGASPEAPRFVLARLGANLNVKPGLTRFLPALLRNSSPFETEVFPIAWQGSGDLANTAKANCFVVVPADRGRIIAGETVSVLFSEA
jgi:molybdopterin molybdotransferase